MKTISRRHGGATRRPKKRRPARRAHSSRGGSVATLAKLGPAVPPVTDVEPDVVSAEAFTVEIIGSDKREEELTDEEALDREERQELY